MRIIEFRKVEEFNDAVQGNVDASLRAIGYLASWAHHSPRYKHLSLFGDARGDLHAVYGDGTTLTYSIFGQRADDGTYSFHS